ncbi:MAG: PTS lactose/cellobiose transporter subunit IIA [Lachnospiraceae bacterium]
MFDLDVACFEIIAAVGEARSTYIMAIAEAKKGNFTEAEALIEQGSVAYAEGHHKHLDLFGSDVPAEFTSSHILLMHAEDQLMAAESFRILASEFIDLYKVILK